MRPIIYVLFLFFKRADHNEEALKKKFLDLKTNLKKRISFTRKKVPDTWSGIPIQLL